MFVIMIVQGSIYLVSHTLIEEFAQCPLLFPHTTCCLGQERFVWGLSVVVI